MTTLQSDGDDDIEPPTSKPPRPEVAANDIVDEHHTDHNAKGDEVQKNAMDHFFAGFGVNTEPSESQAILGMDVDGLMFWRGGLTCEGCC